jgi:KaiC/GvpD/RAD55 family RecA-like ATPase
MNDTQLPYSEVFLSLLKSVHEAILYCHKFNKTKALDDLVESDDNLIEIFSGFEKAYSSGINKHLSSGLAIRHRKRDKNYPRLSKLTIQAYKESQKNPTKTGIILPSPLSIVYQALIIPSEPQTSAYSLVLCRGMLFYLMGMHPVVENMDRNRDFIFISEKDVLDSISSFRKYIKIQLRWPDQREERIADSEKARINFLVGHYLSMKTYSYLWFATEKGVNSFLKVPHFKTLKAFINIYRNPVYRYRISEAYDDLPEQGEIINSLFGIPLPFRGGDVLFHGGLKKSSTGGLVINLSGKPGVGKTSVGLSLAALLSPFNTKTIYISLEEKKEDLYKRLLTLIPDYLKELSIYREPKGIENTDWFKVFEIEDSLNFNELTEIIELINSDLKKDEKSHPTTGTAHLPAICPLYVVIDNINKLVASSTNEKNQEKVEKFIWACRAIGALVILVSADDVPDKINLDYLVDVSIHVEQKGTDDTLAKPIRIFQLTKTRHQISRQGSHVFHLTGSGGFRICPQIPSQMDKKESLRRILYDKTKSITTLNILEQPHKKREYVPYLRVYPNSQILIHGFGSSGKAGLGLKLLLTPSISRPSDFSKLPPEKENVYIEKMINTTDFSKQVYQRKVLVVSFLYPKEYYIDLVKEKIDPALNRIYKNISDSKIKLLPFFSWILVRRGFYKQNNQTSR